MILGSSLAGRLEGWPTPAPHAGTTSGRTLLAGATAGELDEVEAALGVVLPAAYRELYFWSAGVVDELGTAPCLRFRDESLLPLARVVEERGRLLDVYDRCESVDSRVVAPFASFQGSVLVVACGSHRLTSVVTHPVISYFQGFDRPLRLDRGDGGDVYRLGVAGGVDAVQRGAERDGDLAAVQRGRPALAAFFTRVRVTPPSLTHSTRGSV